MRRKLLLLAFLAACNSRVCARHSDCAPPQTCGSAGMCESVDASAPTPDAAIDAATDGGL
jgi:hypothetical protein